MTNRYSQIMNTVMVTDEMRGRVLRQINGMEPEKPRSVTRFFQMRSYAAAAACILIVLAGALAWPHLNQPSVQEEPPQMVSGIVECASAGELSKAVGFEVSDVSGLPFEVKERSYLSYWDKLAEIKYSGDGQSAVFRKSAGREDISGDYNQYGSTISWSSDRLEPGGWDRVTLKGDGGKYSLAVWVKGGYSYSMQIPEGLTEEEWYALLKSVD